MGLASRLSNAFSALFRSPADEALAAAEREHSAAVLAAAFAPGPQPVPFSGEPQRGVRTPPINWSGEGMAPAHASSPPGYMGHTYKTGGAPLGFEGWSLQRVRNAIAAHRLGIFWESSLLMIALLGFAPVLAALFQAIAPIFDLDWYIRGGDRGLAKQVRQDLEDALVPRTGLLPSPFWPPTLRGEMMIYLRMMGFCVLQHVDGEPDPETQLRPRYTRVWPPWAVQYERTIQKWLAYTSEGTIEICNDGKFTLVCDVLEPHLTNAAIVAISEEVLSGRLIQQLRNSWFFKYGNPKLVLTMPEKVATMSDAGNAFFASAQTITGPDGVGALPYGSTANFVGLDSKAAASFGSGLASIVLHIAMVLVGSSDTGIDASEGSGQAVYHAQKGGKWGVRDDLIRRPLICITRALNGGHLWYYVEENHGSEIKAAKRAGTWVYPTLEIPLPKPDHEAQVQARGARYKVALEIVKAAYEDDIAVTADWLAKLSAPECLDLDPPLTLGTVAGPRILAWHAEQKHVAPDEVRAGLRLDPLPNGAGSVEQLATERKEGGDQPGALAKIEAAKVKGDEPSGGEPAEPQPSPHEGEEAAALAALDAALARIAA